MNKEQERQMDNTIDFQSEKDKREIDDKYRLVMPDGSKWYKFFADYSFESPGIGLPESQLRGLAAAGAEFVDARFSFEFWAQSMEDAQRRVEAIKATAFLGGQLYNEIPA